MPTSKIPVETPSVIYAKVNDKTVCIDGLEGKLSNLHGHTPTDHAESSSKLFSTFRALEALTEGQDFLEFKLVREIGRGSFGRVFQATQKGMANRYVALKITTEGTTETEALSRLQHTNIVPIHSTHRHGDLFAVCMPYFGSANLADILSDLKAKNKIPATGAGLFETLVRKLTETPSLRAKLSSLKNSKKSGPTTSSEAAPLPKSSHASKTITYLDTLSKLSYAEGVVWLVSCLADGLRHAHERGISHRDIKPANVLITDEGQPMLVDFNLADDIVQEEAFSNSKLGGTIPYMSPEQLAMFHDRTGKIDERCDLYSLGILFYELVTLRSPFKERTTASPQEIQDMIAERRRGAAIPPAGIGRSIPPAVLSVLRKCLAPEIEDRYQTAEELVEDLRCCLSKTALLHAPDPSLRARIRKWKRQHDMLVAGVQISVTTFVLLFGAGMLYRYRDYQRNTARVETAYATFHDTSELAQCELLRSFIERNNVEEGIRRVEKLVGQYKLKSNPKFFASEMRYLAPEKVSQLRRELTQMLVMASSIRRVCSQVLDVPEVKTKALESALSFNELAEQLWGEKAPSFLFLNKAKILTELGRKEEAEEATGKGQNTNRASAFDPFLAAIDLAIRRDFYLAITMVRNADASFSQPVVNSYIRAISQEILLQDQSSIQSFTECLAHHPNTPSFLVERGRVYRHSQNYDMSMEDLNKAIALEPEKFQYLTERAETYKKIGEFKMRDIARANSGEMPRPEMLKDIVEFRKAADDYTKALDLGAPKTNLVNRSIIRKNALGEYQGALEDEEAFIDGAEPKNVEEFLQHADARRMALAFAEAGRLCDRALQINPYSQKALMSKFNVYLLSKDKGMRQDGIKTIDRLLLLYPDFQFARMTKAKALADDGQRDESVAECEKIKAMLKKNIKLTGTKEQGHVYYQLAAISAVNSKKEPKDVQECLSHLRKSISLQFNVAIANTDPDMKSVAENPAFKKLMADAKKMNGRQSPRVPRTTLPTPRNAPILSDKSRAKIEGSAKAETPVKEKGAPKSE